MKIGIYGGAFNPPHEGHRITANRAKQVCSLDKVIVMPTAVSPHKQNEALATADDRLHMCRLMFSGADFEVSDLEIKKGGKSYTVETLRELKKLYHGDELVLIIGSDMLLSFDKWVEYREILTLCTLCVFSRENVVTPERLLNYAKEKLGLDENEIYIAQTEPVVMCSTEIRKKIDRGEDITAYTGEKIAAYIENRKVYVPDIERTEEFRAVIRKMLRDDRYIHSLGVADSAAQLARIYGEDEKRAYCAGLLHDVTKHIEPSMHEKLVELSGGRMTDEEKSNPSVWHAMSGAAYIKEALNVKDGEIISAVRYHTTGKKGMSLLEKIVYIADFISEDRNYPDVDVMRALAPQSLEKAALYALRYCIGNLIKTGKIIHTDSVDFYNELIMAEKEEK
ncbi:MAG: nicotinate (nicotinamide) nucleotide adenylyltransferase [Clostridia bacterium]|nr:nicotinate (nicotinamide) nucleotide adenylyltransferase [Clostridia bacterium]